MSCCLPFNSQMQRTSEETVVVCYFLMIDRNLQTKCRKIIIKLLQIVTNRYKLLTITTWHCRCNHMFKRSSNKSQDHIHDLNIDHYVSQANDPGKDNVDVFIENNTTLEKDDFYEYPYYIVCLHWSFSATKRLWFRVQYAHHRFIVAELNNANNNAICIHKPNCFDKEDQVEGFRCISDLFISHIMLCIFWVKLQSKIDD